MKYRGRRKRAFVLALSCLCNNRQKYLLFSRTTNPRCPDDGTELKKEQVSCIVFNRRLFENVILNSL